jgi:hypothetical protein
MAPAPNMATRWISFIRFPVIDSVYRFIRTGPGVNFHLDIRRRQRTCMASGFRFNFMISCRTCLILFDFFITIRKLQQLHENNHNSATNLDVPIKKTAGYGRRSGQYD